MAKNTVIYRCKMGTMPYANVISHRPLTVGERVWVPETNSFKAVRVRVTPPERNSGMASCLVERIDEDVLFLTRF
jgi:hypothetical protein